MAEEPDDNHASGESGGNGNAAGGGGGEGGGTTTAVTTPATTGVTTPAPTDYKLIYIAGAALLIYLGFVLYILTQVAPGEAAGDEIRWGRIIYLFSGIESIAFAAAGFLFGREVNRARAETAETLARTEQKRADKATTQRDQAQTQTRVLSERISDLADLTERAQGALPGGSEGMPAAPAASFAPGGGGAAAVPSAAVAPVMLSLVAAEARRLADQASRAAWRT